MEANSDSPPRLSSEQNKLIGMSNETGHSKDDKELDALLDSALNDFYPEPTQTVKLPKPVSITNVSGVSSISSSSQPSTSQGESTKSNSEPAITIDDVIKPFIDQDPQLKSHWEKLTESCNEAAAAASSEDFEQSLTQTLKNLAENAKTIADNTNISDDELAKIWSNLGINDSDLTSEGNGDSAKGMFPDIMPLVTNMMQNLLSKEVLYPALKDLSAKYPRWIEENSEKISAEDLQRYSRQVDLMCQVCDEFDAENNEDSGDSKRERFQKILTIMQQMQACGSPPSDLVGDIPELGNPGDFDFSQLPGMSPHGTPGQCRLM